MRTHLTGTHLRSFLPQKAALAGEGLASQLFSSANGCTELCGICSKKNLRDLKFPSLQRSTSENVSAIVIFHGGFEEPGAPSADRNPNARLMFSHALQLFFFFS